MQDPGEKGGQEWAGVQIVHIVGKLYRSREDVAAPDHMRENAYDSA